MGELVGQDVQDGVAVAEDQVVAGDEVGRVGFASEVRHRLDPSVPAVPGVAVDAVEEQVVGEVEPAPGVKAVGVRRDARHRAGSAVPEGETRTARAGAAPAVAGGAVVGGVDLEVFAGQVGDRLIQDQHRLAVGGVEQDEPGAAHARVDVLPRRHQVPGQPGARLGAGGEQGRVVDGEPRLADHRGLDRRDLLKGNGAGLVGGDRRRRQHGQIGQPAAVGAGHRIAVQVDGELGAEDRDVLPRRLGGDLAEHHVLAADLVAGDPHQDQLRPRIGEPEEIAVAGQEVQRPQHRIGRGTLRRHRHLGIHEDRQAGVEPDLGRPLAGLAQGGEGLGLRVGLGAGRERGRAGQGEVKASRETRGRRQRNQLCDMTTSPVRSVDTCRRFFPERFVRAAVVTPSVPDRRRPAGSRR